MKTYKHIFFDLDHTLWDFEKNSTETLAEIYRAFCLKEEGIPTFEDFLEIYIPVNTELWGRYREGKVTKQELRTTRFKQTLQTFSIEKEQLAEEIGRYYIEHSPRKTNVFPGVYELLGYLGKKYALHIITNGFEEVQFTKMEHSKLDVHFSQVITSEKAGYKKPSPEIFLHAFELTNSGPEEAIMVGDSYEADIVGAKSVGMDQVFFNTKKEVIHENYQVTHEIHQLSDLKYIL